MRNPSYAVTRPEREHTTEDHDAVREQAPGLTPRMPWTPATVLALQQSGVGNRAVARMLSRPVRATLARQDWAVQNIADQRIENALWGKSALHHIIARDRLTALAQDLKRALSSSDEKVRKAAQAFWKEIQLAAGADIVEQTGSDLEPHKRAPVIARRSPWSRRS
jgi:hypothetical protein